MQGIGTDNASVMIGINNGVYKKLKEYNSNLMLIRCVSFTAISRISGDTRTP